MKRNSLQEKWSPDLPRMYLLRIFRLHIAIAIKHTINVRFNSIWQHICSNI